MKWDLGISRFFGLKSNFLIQKCQHLVGPYGFKLDDKSLLRAGLDYWPYVDLKKYEGLF